MRPHVPQEARTSAYGCGTRYPGRARRDGLHGWAARRRGPDGDTRGPRMGSVWSRRETGGDGLAVSGPWATHGPARQVPSVFWPAWLGWK
jgi:hypothetical protein